MPGRTPREAVDAFLDPLQDVVSCLARAKIILSPDGRTATGMVHALTVNRNEPIALGDSCLLLRVRMQYEIVPVEQDDRARWKIKTRAYDYEIQLNSGEAVVSYHWHPGSKVRSPHIHIGRTQLAADAVLTHKQHIPTDRVSLESVVRSCIADWGVKPVRDDWDDVLTLREGDFKLYRSWG